MTHHTQTKPNHNYILKLHQIDRDVIWLVVSNIVYFPYIIYGITLSIDSYFSRWWNHQPVICRRIRLARKNGVSRVDQGGDPHVMFDGKRSIARCIWRFPKMRVPPVIIPCFFGATKIYVEDVIVMKQNWISINFIELARYCPLVICYIANWKITILVGKSSTNGPYSIVMLVYWRVFAIKSH